VEVELVEEREAHSLIFLGFLLLWFSLLRRLSRFVHRVLQLRVRQKVQAR